MINRDQAEDLVETRGGRATSSVSGETDYLVVGTNPGRKLKEARGLGVEILDQDAFEQLVQGD
jgi:DNA ligase (NAD+)